MAKKKKAKKPAKKADEPLVLTSRIKKLINSLGCKTSGDVPDAVNQVVVDAIKKAVARTKANKRSTVRAADL
ncbi:MAG: hypothetical protein JW909_13405 [Planctomycetes bacterium]|nr:hypothetical protein [Planctomycetota bacterium]